MFWVDTSRRQEGGEKEGSSSHGANLPLRAMKLGGKLPVLEVVQKSDGAQERRGKTKDLKDEKSQYQLNLRELCELHKRYGAVSANLRSTQQVSARNLSSSGPSERKKR